MIGMVLLTCPREKAGLACCRDGIVSKATLQGKGSITLPPCPSAARISSHGMEQGGLERICKPCLPLAERRGAPQGSPDDPYNFGRKSCPFRVVFTLNRSLGPLITPI